MKYEYAIINKHLGMIRNSLKIFIKNIKKILKNYWQNSTRCAIINKYFVRRKNRKITKELVRKNSKKYSNGNY